MKQAQQSSVVAAEEGRPEVPLAPAASENAPLGTTLSRLADSTPTILDTDEASDDTDNVFHNPSS